MQLLEQVLVTRRNHYFRLDPFHFPLSCSRKGSHFWPNIKPRARFFFFGLFFPTCGKMWAILNILINLVPATVAVFVQFWLMIWQPSARVLILCRVPLGSVLLCFLTWKVGLDWWKSWKLAWSEWFSRVVTVVEMSCWLFWMGNGQFT